MEWDGKREFWQQQRPFPILRFVVELEAPNLCSMRRFYGVSVDAEIKDLDDPRAGRSLGGRDIGIPESEVVRDGQGRLIEQAKAFMEEFLARVIAESVQDKCQTNSS